MGKVVSSTTGNAKPTQVSGNRVTTSDVPILKNVKPDERRIIFVRHSDTPPLLEDQIAEMTSTVNIALHLAGVPSHIRIERIQRSAKGTCTAASTRGATGTIVVKFKDVILKAIRKHDNGIVDLQTNEKWSIVNIHGLELSRYGKSPEGLRTLR
jgi:hypothetical protein